MALAAWLVLSFGGGTGLAAIPDSLLNEDEVRVLVDLHGLPDEFVRIARCESGYDTEAIGRNRREDGTVWSRDYGLFQINDYWWQNLLDEYDWWDAHDNARMAKKIFDTPNGFKHWVCAQKLVIT